MAAPKPFSWRSTSTTRCPVVNLRYYCTKHHIHHEDPECPQCHTANIKCVHGNLFTGAGVCPQCRAEKMDKIETEMWGKPMTREPLSILVEAEGLVNGPRAQAYGTPQKNFGRWADLCKVMGIDLTPEQLAMVMVLGKLAREANGHKRDNIVDAGGYLEIYERLVEG